MDNTKWDVFLRHSVCLAMASWLMYICRRHNTALYMRQQHYTAATITTCNAVRTCACAIKITFKMKYNKTIYFVVCIAIAVVLQLRESLHQLLIKLFCTSLSRHFLFCDQITIRRTGSMANA